MLKHALVLIVAVMAAGCSSGGEGACFAPGPSCGDTLCSQLAFCATDDGGGNPHCVNELAKGSPCTASEQCSSLQCLDGGCAGDDVPCEDRQ